jgi:hypothetical protein
MEIYIHPMNEDITPEFKPINLSIPTVLGPSERGQTGDQFLPLSVLQLAE